MLDMRSWAVFDITGKGLPSAPYIQHGWSLLLLTYISLGGEGWGCGWGPGIEGRITRERDSEAKNVKPDEK